MRARARTLRSLARVQLHVPAVAAVVAVPDGLAIPLADLILAILRRLKAGKSPFASDKKHLHHRIMRAGNTQQRTAFIMYLWTATIAFPVTVLAFAPIWVAALTAIALLVFTVMFSLGKSKMYPDGKPVIEER